MKIKEIFGQNLQLIVNQFFKGQNNFAKMWSVSEQTVSNWTNGKHFPPLHIILYIEITTGITVMELCTASISIDKSTSSYRISHQNQVLLDEIKVVNDDDHLAGYYKKANQDENILSELKEKIDLLWRTNLHRAEKMEMTEIEIKALRDELERMKLRLQELEKRAGK